MVEFSCSENYSKMFRLLAVLALVAAPISCLPGVRLIYYSSPSAQVVELQEVGLRQVTLDPSKHLKIICHGLAASSSVDWYEGLIQAYLAKGHQVIAMDWEVYANDGYGDAIAATRGVGEVITSYLIKLRDGYGLSLDNVHIIGHSLGAHIAGFAGKIVFETTGKKIGRITGLDPAGPLYTSVGPAERLDAGDAQYVDVIHSNAGTLGLKKSIGTSDFYPDGGSSQNGCGILELGCSHNIAPTYFIESINSDNFVARVCDSYNNYKSGKCASNAAAVMGEGCGSSASGEFYLTTNSKAPYGKGE